MTDKTDESKNNLFSTGEKLLINNTKFPSLENYIEKEQKLKDEYKKWLNKESLAKHICYVDLTFQLPSSERFVILSLAPYENNLEIYKNILKDFINGNHTLYPHHVFQKGIPANIKDGKRVIFHGDSGNNGEDASASYFLFETDKNYIPFDKTEEVGELEFVSKSLDLEEIYQEATDSGKFKINEVQEKNIETHWAEWTKLHKDKASLFKSAVDGELKWILVIPLGIIPNNGQYKNIGAIFLGMDHRCSEADVLYFTRSLILLLLSASQRYYEKLALKNSLQSAIAAIMARNMSHNLGSHVFYFIREELMKLSLDQKYANDKFLISTNKGLTKFLQYVQERQDFVATITSQDHYFIGPLDLKMDVLDELTPDAVDLRHNSEPPTTNFLLKYLVNSEYIQRKLGGETNIENAQLEIALKFGNDTFHSFDEGIAHKFYNYKVAVQGGQQSRHAFLIIIENIVRNAAKHGFIKANVTQTFKIQIDIKENTDDYLLSISDSCGNGDNASRIIKNKLNKLKILNSDISQSIDRENKGLKEIVVCIAWLKNIPFLEVFNEESGVGNEILTVKNEEGNLCYEFSLPKYKMVESVNLEDIKELKNNRAFSKNASVFKCDSNIYTIAKKYLSRCVQETNILDKDKETEYYWQQLAREKYGSDEESFPAIIFERKGAGNAEINKSLKKEDGIEFSETTNFIFVEKEQEIKNEVEKLGKRKYILFKNHLAKNDGSLKTFYENTIKYFGENQPIITESISGANYSFNLFQLAKTKINQNDLYYRIIDAYLTKIVIIDERLCPIETSLADELFNLAANANSCNNFISKYIAKDCDFYNEELQEIFKSTNDVDILQNKILEWWKDVDEEDKKDTVAEDKEEVIRSNSSKTKIRYQEEKNIFLYTMDKLGNIFDGAGKMHETLLIEPHFFSIHISLLDKLFEFELTSGTTTKDKLIYVLHKLNVNKNTYVAVHSGRGGLTDRNQEVTFLPFSNLQWAFENSKYMLNELFQSQIYFPVI